MCDKIDSLIHLRPLTGGFPDCPTGRPGRSGIWKLLIAVPSIMLTRVVESMKADM
jgi:hypothetical protein